MPQENERLMRRFFEEVWNRGDYAIVDDLLAGDYVGHSPPDEIHGPEGGKRFVAALRGAFPDIHFTIEDQIADGDRVVARWTARGTQTGAFQGLPPTGKQAVATGITIFRVANGKAVEGWTNFDALGLLRQLGVVAAPGRAGS
jgi:steroid delta-isomerase-like uncharacterized protein